MQGVYRILKRCCTRQYNAKSFVKRVVESTSFRRCRSLKMLLWTWNLFNISDLGPLILIYQTKQDLAHNMLNFILYLINCLTWLFFSEALFFGGDGNVFVYFWLLSLCFCSNFDKKNNRNTDLFELKRFYYLIIWFLPVFAFNVHITVCVLIHFNQFATLRRLVVKGKSN